MTVVPSDPTLPIHCAADEALTLGPPWLMPLCLWAEKRATGLAPDDALNALMVYPFQPGQERMVVRLLFDQLWPRTQCPDCLAWLHA